MGKMGSHERRGHNEGKNHKAAPSSGKGQPARLPKVAEMTINYFVESQREKKTLNGLQNNDLIYNDLSQLQGCQHFGVTGGLNEIARLSPLLENSKVLK